MWVFGDGFDLYATGVNTSDAWQGYWDTGNYNAFQSVAGRFANSRAIYNYSSGSGQYLAKSSGANDAIHHLTFAYQNTATLIPGGTLVNFYLQLMDGASNQCAIGFRQDGAIVLFSGTPAGTVLATWANAVPWSGAWFTYEFEITIDPAAGHFTARRNGNPSNDFSATSLNTRGGSTNSWANRLSIGMYAWGGGQASGAYWVDDLLWRSDPASVPWSGDVRCFPRMPGADVQAQFSKFPASGYLLWSYNGTGYSSGPATNAIWFNPLNGVAISGQVTSLIADFSAATTGHVNMALYDASGPGGLPGNLLGACTPLTNPATGLQVFNLPTPIPVTKGGNYWVALVADAAVSINGTSANNSVRTLAGSYAGGFPSSAANTTPVGLINGFHHTGINSITPANSALVNEPQEDGLTTYVYDGNIGDSDLYSLQSTAPSAPTSILMTTLRGFVEKSDAGARGAALQLKSGATVVQSPTTLLSASFGWLWRNDLTDPATGAAWTPSAVSAAQIGPVVVS